MLPSINPSIEQHQSITDKAEKLITKLNTSTLVYQRQLLSKLLNRVEIHQDKIVLDINARELTKQASATHRIEVPYQLTKRGVEARLVIGQNKIQKPKPDQQLNLLIAKAHEFLNKLTNGSASSISELAKTHSQSASQISRMLQFTFLAPEIIESILAGAQPAGLTAEKLRRLSHLPLNWNEQKELLGFNS